MRNTLVEYPDLEAFNMYGKPFLGVTMGKYCIKAHTNLKRWNMFYGMSTTRLCQGLPDVCDWIISQCKSLDWDSSQWIDSTNFF